MKAKIYITLKPGLLDAQGKTVKGALDALGFKGIQDVRMGKYIEIELNHGSATSAKHDIERMCKKLLANPVIETYRIELAEGSRLKARGKPPASSLQPRARAKRA